VWSEATPETVVWYELEWRQKVACDSEVCLDGRQSHAQATAKRHEPGYRCGQLQVLKWAIYVSLPASLKQVARLA